MSNFVLGKIPLNLPIQVLSIFNHLNVGALLEGANNKECIQGFSGSKIRFFIILQYFKCIYTISRIYFYFD